MRKRIWITTDILKWPVMAGSRDALVTSNWKRAYEIWQHASAKLLNNPTDLDRTDAITSLKRCINQRLKQFELSYRIRPFLIENHSQYLVILEKLGLVRPLLLQSLMEIRNKIEHEDQKPPKLDRCLEMLDVVWYFLKSTDTFIQLRTSSLVFETPKYDHSNDENRYWINIDIEQRNKWKLIASGWLPQENISLISKPDQIEILVDKLNTNQEEWKREGVHLDKLVTNLYFSGSIIALPNQLEFARLYFSAY